MSLASDLKMQIAADLQSARPSKPIQATIRVTDPWEAHRKSPPDSEYERFAGDYTWTYDSGLTRVEKQFPYRSVTGANYTARTGWIRSRLWLYEYDGAIEYPNAPTTSRVSGTDEIVVPNPSQAFMFQGVPYDEMISSGDSISAVQTGPAKAELSGIYEHLPFSMKLDRAKGTWRLTRLDRTLEKNGRRFQVYVRVENASDSGQPATLIALGYPQPGQSNDENERTCAVVKITPVHEPVTVQGRVPPGTLAVDKNTVYQVGAEGKLIEAAVPVQSEVNRWGLLYVASATGLVFFSGLILKERAGKRRTSKKKA